MTSLNTAQRIIVALGVVLAALTVFATVGGYLTLDSYDRDDYSWFPALFTLTLIGGTTGVLTKLFEAKQKEASD